jgi:hypothetical protein
MVVVVVVVVKKQLIQKTVLLPLVVHIPESVLRSLNTQTRSATVSRSPPTELPNSNQILVSALNKTSFVIVLNDFCVKE